MCQPTQVRSWSTMAQAPPLWMPIAVRLLTNSKIWHFKPTPWLIAPRRLQLVCTSFEQETTGYCTKTSKEHWACYNMLDGSINNAFKFSLDLNITEWSPLMAIETILDTVVAMYGHPTPICSSRMTHAPKVCIPQTTHLKSSSTKTRTVKESKSWGTIPTLPRCFLTTPSDSFLYAACTSMISRVVYQVGVFWSVWVGISL